MPKNRAALSTIIVIAIFFSKFTLASEFGVGLSLGEGFTSAYDEHHQGINGGMQIEYKFDDHWSLGIGFNEMSVGPTGTSPNSFISSSVFDEFPILARYWGIGGLQYLYVGGYAGPVLYRTSDVLNNGTPASTTETGVSFGIVSGYDYHILSFLSIGPHLSISHLSAPFGDHKVFNFDQGLWNLNFQGFIKVWF